MMTIPDSSNSIAHPSLTHVVYYKITIHLASTKNFHLLHRSVKFWSLAVIPMRVVACPFSCSMCIRCKLPNLARFGSFLCCVLRKDMYDEMVLDYKRTSGRFVSGYTTNGMSLEAHLVHSGSCVRCRRHAKKSQFNSPRQVGNASTLGCQIHNLPPQFSLLTYWTNRA